jgi:hypothetical protein
MSPAPPRPPPTDIDALYGLEPVFEPDQSDCHEPGTQSVSVSCPYCGEFFDTLVDISAGSASYIEDCQICCQPIEMALTVDDSGQFTGLSARRGD